MVNGSWGVRRLKTPEARLKTGTGLVGIIGVNFMKKIPENCNQPAITCEKLKFVIGVKYVTIKGSELSA